MNPKHWIIFNKACTATAGKQEHFKRQCLWAVWAKLHRCDMREISWWLRIDWSQSTCSDTVPSGYNTITVGCLAGKWRQLYQPLQVELFCETVLAPSHVEEPILPCDRGPGAALGPWKPSGKRSSLVHSGHFRRVGRVGTCFKGYIFVLYSKFMKLVRIYKWESLVVAAIIKGSVARLTEQCGTLVWIQYVNHTRAGLQFVNHALTYRVIDVVRVGSGGGYESLGIYPVDCLALCTVYFA